MVDSGIEVDPGTARVKPLIEWLIKQSLADAEPDVLLQGYCDHLVALGLPVWRFFLGLRALHPNFGGIGFDWTRNDGMSSRWFEYSSTPREDWLKSPLYHYVNNNMEELRIRAEVSDAYKAFPLLEDLQAQGMTDYFVKGLFFDGARKFNHESSPPVPEGILVSWSSDRPGGFSGADLDILRTTMPFLGLALKSASNRRLATDLLKVYLGRDAGGRVLSGEFQRGSSRQIDAVICLFDLKGFTSLAEQLPGAELIEMLNDYFGLVVGAIQGHGGNILKFMGDGILAMFDLGDIEQDALAALDAASALCVQVGDRNAERHAQGLPVAGFTLALHAGEILYGNIGAENRLDFTVIGPNVNLTARISDMHDSVGQSIIVSEHVQKAAASTRHDLVSLGRYMLRGVSEPIELYTVFQPGSASKDAVT